jgi:hypothetical protein
VSPPNNSTATAIPAGTAPYIDAILAELPFADPTYQRDLDPKRVTKMVSEFDQRLVGVLEVSARDDGRFAILDGQHRWAATCRAHPYGTHAHLACQIHTVLSVEEEARLYYELDTKRSVDTKKRGHQEEGTGRGVQERQGARPTRTACMTSPPMPGGSAWTPTTTPPPSPSRRSAVGGAAWARRPTRTPPGC